MTKLCAVFVCNKEFFNKFIYSCNQLITIGKYNGDICLVIGDDLNGNKNLLNNDLKSLLPFRLMEKLVFMVQ